MLTKLVLTPSPNGYDCAGCAFDGGFDCPTEDEVNICTKRTEDGKYQIWTIVPADFNEKDGNDNLL